MITMNAALFDASAITDPETGNITYDRVSYSKDFADIFKAFFSNGILVLGHDLLTNELQTLHLSAMTCVVKPGAIIINGRPSFLETQETIEFAVGGSSPRIDRVVIELNIADRNFYIKILKGIASASPAPPALTQTEDIYQIPLAQVRVNANQSVIASVTDERAGYISNVLLNQKPSDDITAATVGISEAVRLLYRLTADNANVDKALQANPPKTMVIKEFTTSQTWTVPSNVRECDLYLVDGGNGGEPGNTGAGLVSNGGRGGKGGNIIYVQNIKLTPNENITITIGYGGSTGAEGGKTLFKSYSTEYSYCYQSANDGSTGAGTTIEGLSGQNENTAYVLCPLNGKLYGLSGAPGGGTNKATSGTSGGGYNFSHFGISIIKSGGVGITDSNNYVFLGGGGASADNNGTSAVLATKTPGDGASALANTGNGGGGGGAVYNGSRRSNGGTGGSGIVIIRYFI